MKIFNWVHRRFYSNKVVAEVGKNDEQFEDENKCNDVFERLGGGILSIGTLGYDPLKDEEMKDVCNDLLYEEEELEIAALMEGCDAGVEINEEKADVEDSIEREEEFGFEYMMMEKRARTTLADLFSADSQGQEDIIKNQPSNRPDFSKDKTKRNHKFKFDEARPIHKLNQLMRKMLKRKIYPEIGVVSSKVPVVKKCDVNDHASLLLTPDAII